MTLHPDEQARELELVETRLKEARWWSEHWNAEDWLKLCRHRLTKLENQMERLRQAVGERAK